MKRVFSGNKNRFGLHPEYTVSVPQSLYFGALEYAYLMRTLARDVLTQARTPLTIIEFSIK